MSTLHDLSDRIAWLEHELDVTRRNLAIVAADYEAERQRADRVAAQLKWLDERQLETAQALAASRAECEMWRTKARGLTA